MDNRDSYWITQLETNDRIALERDREQIEYQAVADQEAHTTYHKLRREKYGWADQTLEILGGKAAECNGVPVRLKLI